LNGPQSIPARKILVIVGLVTLAVGFLPGCAAVNRLHHPDPGLVFAPGDQPDKVLYQKAIHEVAHSNYEVGRLTLQTLINTYPDSEYLSKAKLAIADSYYAEGGVSGFTQAESEYKDFITFFPTAPEAPEAQYRVGMSHFRLLAKADRDQTEALNAEAEFKEFLLKYPDSPLVTRVKGRLRQTQQVLAEGDFFTASFYYQHNAFLASRSRFQEIIDKYPDYSDGDQALFYLGQSLEHLRKGRDSIVYYSHVVTDFPLSPIVPQAKVRLVALKAPIPRPTRAMLARARADATHKVDENWITKTREILSSAPNTTATLYGPVHLGKAGSGIDTSAPLGPATPGSTIQATPLGEKSSPSAQAGGSGTAANPGGTANSGATKADSGSTKAQADASANPKEDDSKAKKKSKFHIFKKIVPL
jgi:outer membrane protein assembly factor BamD